MSSSSTNRRFIVPAALPLAVVALLGLLFVVSPIGAQTPTDRDVLVALYNATDGGNWRTGTNWLSQEPLGDWHGVTTNSDGRVTALKLNGNNLSGQIPSELGDLTNLKDLWLDNNSLSGGVPSELGSLANLDSLYVNQNSLTGVLP